MDFRIKLNAAVRQNSSLLCVGLDPDLSKMPWGMQKTSDPLFNFNKAIIDATADLVCCFKPNSAFYESSGAEGIRQLKKTCDYIRDKYAYVPILLDFKRGDIGNTNEHYAKFAFDYLGVDAVTIQPYLGREANEAFLWRQEKGIFVLCRTSNPGAGELQDIEGKGRPLYQFVAQLVAEDWNERGNCHLVMGAPFPEELAWARQHMGEDMVFLCPGVGTQGGSLEETVKSGINRHGAGIIINSSREVLYASDEDNFANAARTKAAALREEINNYRG